MGEKNRLECPAGSGKEEKSRKSESRRGMGEKNRLKCPAGSGKEEKKREK